MALFGDLGKALGLGSGKDILPIIGTAAGFYFGGPMGASIGSGIGTLAGGGNVNDVLTNAALSYGVTSFISPSFAQKAGFQQAGVQPGFLQKKIYGIESVAPKMIGDPSIRSAVEPGIASIEQDVSTAMKGQDKSLFSGIFDDFDMKDAFLATSLGGAALQALDKPEEGTPQRDPVGGAFGTVTGPFSKKVYDIEDPVDVAEYNKELLRYQEEDFEYDLEPVRAAHGGAIQGHPEAHGAMYRHDKMGYDVALTGEVEGPGSGTSDSVPARLSDGEFVLTAKAVRGAGGGDRDIGAARLYDMMAELEATA